MNQAISLVRPGAERCMRCMEPVHWKIEEDVLTKPGRYKTIAENLYAKEVATGDCELRRRYILCYRPRKAEKQRKHREQVVKEL
jgi:hypothetical protein